MVKEAYYVKSAKVQVNFFVLNAMVKNILNQTIFLVILAAEWVILAVMIVQKLAG